MTDTLTRKELFKHNFVQMMVAFDQLCRCILGLCLSLFYEKAYADETLSAYSYRKSKSSVFWHGVMLCINGICFNANHCKHAFEHEIDLPPEYKRMV